MIEVKIICTCILIIFVSSVFGGVYGGSNSLTRKTYLKHLSSAIGIIIFFSCTMILGSLLSLIWS